MEVGECPVVGLLKYLIPKGPQSQIGFHSSQSTPPLQSLSLDDKVSHDIPADKPSYLELHSPAGLVAQTKLFLVLL